MRGSARATAPVEAGAQAALRLVPRTVAAAVLRYAARRISGRYPALLQRLTPLGGRTIAIDVDEFPHAIVLAMTRSGIAIAPLARERMAEAAAVIGGQLSALVALVEGRADGDALFFQRSIRFSGDTEVVLLMRNALEAAEIDVFADLLPPVPALARAARATFEAYMGAASEWNAPRDRPVP